MNNLLDEIADFTWSFGEEWFLETSHGNYTWSDPDYGGDNTMKPFNGTYGRWCQIVGVPYGRDKGKHIIRDYCGERVCITS